MSGFVEITHGTGEIISKAGQLGATGDDFAAAVADTKASHNTLAVLDTFGDDKLGHQFMASYHDTPSKVFAALEKVGRQLSDAAQQLKDGVGLQEGTERANLEEMKKVKP